LLLLAIGGAIIFYKYFLNLDNSVQEKAFRFKESGSSLKRVVDLALFYPEYLVVFFV